LENSHQAKSSGGLGVINFELQNKALLMKYLHKFYNRVDILWVNIIWANHYSNSLPSVKLVGSFWWKDILKIQGSYKELARVEIGDGKTTLLWHDNWDGMCKSARFLELWSFASIKDITIHQARLVAPNEMFHTPLSVEAFEQLHALKTFWQISCYMIRETNGFPMPPLACFLLRSPIPTWAVTSGLTPFFPGCGNLNVSPNTRSFSGYCSKID
jgi:hypothetical protein